MIDLGAILEGHIKEAAHLENELFEKRMAICIKCPLCQDSPLGKVCSSKLYYNPNTETASAFPCAGCIEGCGCRLHAKTRVLKSQCVLGKW